VSGGKGHERLNDRTSISSAEMQRRWDRTFRSQEEEVCACCAGTGIDGLTFKYMDLELPCRYCEASDE
jgi:hypothetical protein